MVASDHILETLKLLDRKFNSAVSEMETQLYSKLAILELCGWLEESMDDIVLSCARTHLKNKKNIKYVEDEIVKETYGFQYDKHFRKMLIRLLGIIKVERVENEINQDKWDQFKSTLSSLKNPRNSEAHTHVKGTTTRIDAPSVTIGHLESLREGLIEFDNALRKQNLVT